MIDWLQRLRERKLGQWALAYLAGAWVVLEVYSVVADQFDWPIALGRALILLLVVGFLATLVLAWYHGEKGRQRVGGAELLMLTALLIIAGAAVTWTAGQRRNAVAPAAESASERSAGRETLALTIGLPDTDTLLAVGSSSLALSPDGETIVYAARRLGRRWLLRRELDGFEAVPIEGTEGGEAPFFSPDGEWIGFFDVTERVLKKVPLGGGRPHALAPSDGASGTWAENDTIVFENFPFDGLWQVPAAGGRATPLTRPEDHFVAGEEFHRDPYSLAGGKLILFTGFGQGAARVALYDRATDRRFTLVRDAAAPLYVPGGHIVYGRFGEGDVLSAPFDSADHSVGSPTAALEGVVTQWGGRVHYAISRDGRHLAYVPGGLLAARRQLLWVDDRGRADPIDLEPGDYAMVRVSPDGARLALRRSTGRVAPSSSIWTVDLDRPELIRLTDGGGAETWPVWSADGSRILFNSNRYASGSTAPYNLYWKAADGSGTEERLAESPMYQQPYSVGLDGSTIAFQESTDPETGFDIAFLDLQPDRSVRRPPELRTAANETHPALSPDGEWLAFTSDATERYEVYLRPIAKPGPALRVSTSGGQEPIWKADGSALYYRDMSGDSVYAVAFADRKLGSPRLLFAGSFLEGWPWGRNYDLAPDGRFLMVTESDDLIPAREIRVIRNWGTTLR